MAGANWWEADSVVAPAGPKRILGAPKTPAPQTDAQRVGDELGVTVKQNTIADRPIEIAGKKSAMQTQAMERAGRLRDDYDQSPEVKGYIASLPMYIAALNTAEGPEGDRLLITAFGKLSDPTTGVLTGESRAIEESSPTLEALRARFGNEIDASGRFSPRARQALRAELAQLMAKRNEAFIAARVKYKGIADRNGVDPMDVVGEHPGGRFQDEESKFLGRPVSQADYQGNVIPTASPPKPDGPITTDGSTGQGKLDAMLMGREIGEAPPRPYQKLSPTQEADWQQFLLTKPNADAITTRWQTYGVGGLKAGDAEKAAEYYAQGGTGYGGVNYSAMASGIGPDEQKRIDAGSASRLDAAGEGAGQAITVGSLDEIDAGLNAFGRSMRGDGAIGDNYASELAVARGLRDKRTNAHPYSAFAGSMLGGVALPFGAGAKTVQQFAKTGAGLGAAYGFMGTDGTLGERVLGGVGGAAGGGVAGAAVGKVAPIVGQKLADIYQRQVAKNSGASVRASAQPIADAAVAEGVPISRPFIDPSVRNKVTYLETTRGGNMPVREGMAATADAIEGRAAALARGGNALDEYAAGTAIQDAGKGYIARAKDVVDRMYDRARKGVPQGFEVKPEQAIATIDGHLAELNKAPAQNAGVINYLKGIRSDMLREPVDTGLLDAAGKPIMRPGEGLSIDTMRAMRTNMRGHIGERNLTLTDAERRATDVLQSASRDIQTQLQQAAPKAGNDFIKADTAFRLKQAKIERAIKPFLGPRLNNITPEAAFSRFESMAKNRGNREALQSIWTEIPASEQRNLAATFAEPLGRDEAGDFSPARFIRHAAKLSSVARETIFGPQGAESIQNLVRLSNAYRKVSNNLNNSRTGVAANYRNRIASLAGMGIGGAGGFVTGGAGGAALGLVAARAGANRLETTLDRLSAESLMSPNITKWLERVPTSSQQVQEHIARLSVVAAREPVVSGEILALQQRLYDAFGSTPARLAAQPGEKDKNGRPPPPNRNGGNDAPRFHVQ